MKIKITVAEQSDGNKMETELKCVNRHFSVYYELYNI